MYQKLYLYVTIILAPSITYAAFGTKLPSRQAAILQVWRRLFSSDVTCDGTRFPCCNNETYRTINGCYMANKAKRLSSNEELLAWLKTPPQKKLQSLTQPQEVSYLSHTRDRLEAGK